MAVAACVPQTLERRYSFTIVPAVALGNVLVSPVMPLSSALKIWPGGFSKSAQNYKESLVKSGNSSKAAFIGQSH
jgi:hypothetical protein